MMYFLFTLLKTILYMEQKWNEILIRREAELDERQKSIDSLFKLFNILTIRRDDIPKNDDFILKFRHVDIAMSKQGEDISKYAIIEKIK